MNYKKVTDNLLLRHASRFDFNGEGFTIEVRYCDRGNDDWSLHKIEEDHELVLAYVPKGSQPCLWVETWVEPTQEGPDRIVYDLCIEAVEEALSRTAWAA